MPSARAIKARNRQYYNSYAEGIRSRMRDNYQNNPQNKKDASRACYKANPNKAKETARKQYNNNPELQKAASHDRYRTHSETIKEDARKQYKSNPEPKRRTTRKRYGINPVLKRRTARERYRINPEPKMRTARKRYNKNPERKKAAARVRWARNRDSICAQKRAKYALFEPKLDVKDMYVKDILSHLLADAEARSLVSDSFPKIHINDKINVSVKAMCRVAAKKLLNKALQIRRLLQAARLVQSMELTDKNDFGDGCHKASTEPFFYDSAYKLVKKEYALPIDTNGRCITAKNVCTSDEIPRYSAKEPPMKWECSSECKILSDNDVCTIIDLAAAFQKPMRELRCELESVDSGCPNQHYTKYVDTTMQLKGHPLVCFNDSGCHSKLRILRSAATHYPVLVTLSHHVYQAIGAHVGVQMIDRAMGSGDFHTLMEITKTCDFETLLSNDIDTSYEQCTEAADSVLIHAGVENKLLIEHAQLITQFENEIDEYPEHVCCSCECLYQRKSVTKVKLTDKLGNSVWSRMKEYILGQCPNTDEVGTLYMCHYCKSSIKNNKLPPRCVLNGLQQVPIPAELAKLDALSAQLIQLAKCYQTVVRLGTYTGKVPIYNSLKACNGTMFFLPLPLNKTLGTLHQANLSGKRVTALPDPELYIIVNGKPTKCKIVWRILVNVANINAAVCKLKEINWLYGEVDKDSVDDVYKKVIEITNSATSRMLVKASESDVSGFQAFTVRNLDNKLSTDTDIEQYKLLNVREDPISNRQEHLDVMCFPTLFPTGKFGKNHPREVKISHSEYDKSRLLNKDSRFRKHAPYVFYLLWQKEMRELSAGVYNLMKKSNRIHQMTASNLLSNVQSNDEHLEANLCTMLQSVRGSQQYWFVRKSELKCMIREYGSPTLFLTFSCAEYESADIANYLRKLNDVPPTYNIGKLCTEDPISVSRKFSLKFHAFFKTVLLKGEVLGTVEHFYWKKEYQARGAPHYHVLLWIKDAPVIGRDDPDVVLSWMQERITCKKFLTNRVILSCTVWSQGTSCTSAVGIASASESVVTHTLPGADLRFHGNRVKLPN